MLTASTPRCGADERVRLEELEAALRDGKGVSSCVLTSQVAVALTPSQVWRSTRLRFASLRECCLLTHRGAWGGNAQASVWNSHWRVLEAWGWRTIAHRSGEGMNAAWVLTATPQFEGTVRSAQRKALGGRPYGRLVVVVTSDGWPPCGAP
jgi:hypothetical protein